MVKIELLLKEGKISRINEMELSRYVSFFEVSYKDNLNHSKENLERFPRWAIISGYYAMHDITKLFLAKKFRIKIEKEVHATTIKVLKELVKKKAITKLIENGYRTFLTLAQDLEEAKRERVKAQYFTGTKFMQERYQKKAKEMDKEVVDDYIKKIKELLR